MKKLLFVSYGGGHANIVRMLYPVLHKKYDIIIIALTVAGSIFDKYCVPYKKIKDYLSLFEYRDEVIGYGKRLAEKSFDPMANVEYEDLVVYLGLSFFDLCVDCGNKEIAEDLYEKSGRHVFSPTHTMRKIVRFESPDAIILTSSTRMEKATGIVANEMGIPVLRILDLMECNSIPYKCNLCVMNEMSKEIMMSKCPTSIERIFVTGQPVFDENKIIDEVEVELFREKYFTREFGDVIIFFAQTYQYEMQLSICDKLGEIAANNPKDLFIVKLHPNDNRGILMGGENRENFHIIKNEITTRTLLHVCTLAMTMDSTVGLEAVLLDRPLLLINTQDVALDIDFSKYDIAEKCTDIDELESMIYKNLYNGETIAKMRAKRRKFNTESDAASKIVAVVKKIIN